MKNIALVLFILLSITACNTQKQKIADNIPSLEELSGVWVSADTADMEPSIRNFRGQALVNRDLTSISWFVSAPYCGGYHTGTMRLNGKTPMVSSFRWQPYQALRKGKIDNFEVLSSTRMLVEEDAIMWEVEITNKNNQEKELNIDLDMIGFISKYGGNWQWWYPYPKLNGKVTKRDSEMQNVRKFIGKPVSNQKIEVTELVNGKPQTLEKIAKWPSDEEILASKKHNATADENNTLFIQDTETEAVTVFHLTTQAQSMQVKNSGGTASWKVTLKPNETKTIKYLMAYGDDKNKIKQDIINWSENFDKKFESIKTRWESRWEEVFKPNNKLFSGCFPTLETNDAKAKKVYYTGPLTMLYLTNLNLPQHKKVFLTGGPRWGASITFFWDITLWSTLWSVVDPQMMKEHISAWIKIDPSKHFGKDNFGGKGVGNGYSANYWALFQMMHGYITVSKDFDFLNKEIEGKTVLQHMETYALNWKKISIHGKEGCSDDTYKLADFGDDEWNLLECVPTYKHIVPSFNAGYIWMMRETAKIHEKLGNNKKAKALTDEANEMFDRLLKLYAGNGVWYSLYPNNKKIEVRHCLDFMFLGKYLAKDIPENIKKDMMDFVYRELMTDNWMRAQSLQDVAAERSDRCDHGPLGAFDGWPAEIMDALAQMGYTDKAFEFYHNIEPVTYEGIWSQAHELYGEDKKTKKAKVRIAQRGWHNRESSSGVAMSQVMLKNFFGFYPDVQENPIKMNENWTFDGKLHHVLYGGEYYTIEYKDGKPVMVKE